MSALRALVIGLSTLCIVSGCAKSPVGPNAVDLDAEKKAVLQQDQAWHAAVAEKKDAAKIASFFTTDGIMFGSGQRTDVGRAALTESIEALLAGPDFRDDWKWDRVELSPDGKLAYLVGTTSITINDSSGRPVTTRARLLNVWRKEPDGQWRCVVDAWVDEPASPVAAQP